MHIRWLLETPVTCLLPAWENSEKYALHPHCIAENPILHLDSLRTNRTTYFQISTNALQSIARFQSRRLGFTINPSQVVVAPGSKPPLFTFFDILEGDVLLPRPSWVSYEPQVKHAGKRLFWVETDEEDRHTITREYPTYHFKRSTWHHVDKRSESSLEASFNQAIAEGSRPTVMLINSPSNPTGQSFSAATVRTIATFCKDRGITLISDEIYSDITFDEESRTSPCTMENFESARMILTGGLSKVRCQSQWRRYPKTSLTYSTDILCWGLADRLCCLPKHRIRDDRPECHPCIRFRVLVCCLSSGSRSSRCCVRHQ